MLGARRSSASARPASASPTRRPTVPKRVDAASISERKASQSVHGLYITACERLWTTEPPPLSNAPSRKGRQIQSPLSPTYGAFTNNCYAHEKMSKADSQVIVFQALRQIERSSMSEEHGPINC